MSSTLSFLDQFNAPSTEGGKRLSIYTPKHTHLKAHNPEATNATDRAALEAYLSARREYDEAVKAADEAIDHHKRLLRQQDDRVLTELIRLDNLKVAHRFQPLLPRSIRAQHNKFIPRAIPNAYLPLPAPLPTSALRCPPIPPPFLQATPRSTTIPADWQPNPGWTPKGSCRRCGSSRHWVRDCPDVRCAGCGKEAPGHLERECGTRPMKRHVSAPPEEPARRVGVVVDNAAARRGKCSAFEIWSALSGDRAAFPIVEMLRLSPHPDRSGSVAETSPSCSPTAPDRSSPCAWLAERTFGDYVSWRECTAGTEMNAAFHMCCCAIWVYFWPGWFLRWVDDARRTAGRGVVLVLRCQALVLCSVWLWHPGLLAARENLTSCACVRAFWWRTVLATRQRGVSAPHANYGTWEHLAFKPLLSMDTIVPLHTAAPYQFESP
ncbi:predicted protein [Postia placenta Mad-698-R]|nr:predicted protein [Postia placenta Mad-698-R]